MSLAASTLFNNIQNPDKTGVVGDLGSQSENQSAGRSFRFDRNSLTYYPIIPNPGDNAFGYWRPATGVNADYLVLGIGDADQIPTSGTTTLNYNAVETGLSGISAQMSASALETQFNASAPVIGTGQTVEVTELADGTFQIDWSGVGAKYLFQGDGAGLIPESNVYSAWIVEGDGSTKASQILQFIQRPLVYVNEWTPTDSPEIEVTELAAGDGSTKAKFQVSIAALAYEGAVTIKGSAPIAYNATQEDALTALGEDWGSCVKTGTLVYTIERAATGAYSLTESDINIDAIKYFSGFVGKLEFNKAALIQRFAATDDDAISTFLQIRHNDGEYNETLLLIGVTLNKDILSPGATGPSNWSGNFYTITETDALLAEKVEGPASATDSAIVLFDGTGGKLVKDSGVTISTDGTLASNSDQKVPSEKATKTFVTGLIDTTIKQPEAFDAAAATDLPENYGGSPAKKGDAWRVSTNGTVQGVELEVFDLIIADVDTPDGTDPGDYQVLQANVGAATESTPGVAPIASNAVVDAETNDTDIVTVLKMVRYFNNQDLSVRALVTFVSHTADYTFNYDADISVSDHGPSKEHQMNSATSKTFTFPQDSDEAFPVGAVIPFSRQGAGDVLFAAGSGATVTAADGATKLRSQHSIAYGIKTASNTWQVRGDIA